MFSDSSVCVGTVDVCSLGFVYHSPEHGPLPFSAVHSIQSLSLIDVKSLIRDTAASSSVTVSQWALHADLESAIAAAGL